MDSRGYGRGATEELRPAPVGVIGLPQRQHSPGVSVATAAVAHHRLWRRVELPPVQRDSLITGASTCDSVRPLATGVCIR